MLPSRTDASRLALLLSSLMAAPLLAQTTSIAPPSLTTQPAATTAPAPAEALAVASPFVGTVLTDKVYVRSGPGTVHYEVGQLAKGDTVQVVGSRQGWYQVLPPNGSFCMIAKEFVETDADGKTGTVKADYVNVRAGTAIYPTRDPHSVLTVARKGTKLTILGSTDKFYKVAPTERAYLFIAPQFIAQAPAGTEYKIPSLKYPAGTVGIGTDTVTSVAALPDTTRTIDVEPPVATRPTETPTNNGGSTETATTQRIVEVVPATTFSKDAIAKFNDLNARTQKELGKKLGERDYTGLIAEYKALLATSDIPPSVKIGSESRLAALEKLATIQKLAKDGATGSETLEAQRKALQEQSAAALAAVEAAERSGPYLAEGRLQTSTTLKGKYAIINPATGRVVAYVEPDSEIEISALLGKYIGIRGVTVSQVGTEVAIIRAKNATLLPEPKLPARD